MSTRRFSVTFLFEAICYASGTLAIIELTGSATVPGAFFNQTHGETGKGGGRDSKSREKWYKRKKRAALFFSPFFTFIYNIKVDL